MKTYLIAILALGITYSISAQQDYSDTNSEIKNAQYLSKVYAKENAKKVNKLQHIVSRYNIESSNLFDSTSNETYEIVFEESNCKIVATYNKESEIIKSKELFNKIRLPNQLAIKVSTEYPGWMITENSYEINYVKDETVTKIFTVTIGDNITEKILKFSLMEEPELTFVSLKN